MTNKIRPAALRLFSLLTLTTLLLSACSQAPDYTDSNGNSARFSDHHGKWLIINYWAIWCKPCIKEIPELNHLAAENPQKLVLLGVDFDGSQGEKLQDSIEKLAIDFPVLLLDPAPLLGYEVPKVLPTTLIFDPRGKLTHTLLGPQTADSLLAKLQAGN